MCAFIDPGIKVNSLRPSKQFDKEKCMRCNILLEPGLIHCETCDVCIEKFDHHCPWTGKCIGKGNYLYF